MTRVIKRPIERIAYRRDEAAAVLGVSESKFADWERRKMMPPCIHVDGCRLYDADQLRAAWQAVKEGREPEFDSDNPYDAD